MESGAAEFYDALSDHYDLVYHDWRDAVVRQGRVIDGVIESRLGKGSWQVLDCSCGIGTQAIGLALCGYRVRATDVSPRAVERAGREAASFGASVETGVADFRDLERQVSGTFDVVLSCDNSLPHLLTDPDLRLALRSMRSKLRPGGLLVIGVRDYDALVLTRPRSTSPQVIDGPGGRRVVFQVWDWADDGRTYVANLFVVRAIGGTWETEHHATRYKALRRDELERALREAAFTDFRWSEPVDTGHHQPIITATTPPSRRGDPA